MTESIDPDTLNAKQEEDFTRQTESPLFPYLGFMPDPLLNSPGSIEAWDLLPDHMKERVNSHNTQQQRRLKDHL